MWIRLIALFFLCCSAEQNTTGANLTSDTITDSPYMTSSSITISTIASTSSMTTSTASTTSASSMIASTTASTSSTTLSTSAITSSSTIITPKFSSTSSSAPTDSTFVNSTTNHVSNDYNLTSAPTLITTPTSHTDYESSSEDTTHASTVISSSISSKATSVSTQSEHFTSTSTSPATTENKLGTILPAAIVPVVVCSTVAILVFFYLRRSKQKTPGSIDKKVTSKAIDILGFENVIRDMNANSQLKFSEEFMALAPVGKEYSKDVAGQEINREKNRYTDIKPYDISRVKLSINPEDESDYINASWIPGYFSRRQYIAAQGPMPSTQDDFWRMVWEYNSRIIVMLTKTVENNRMKCCQYWPADKEVVMYGDIAVSIIDETETDSWITREMNVSMGQQKRLVKQCFFTKWPDMKTPEDSSSIIDFIRMVRSFCPIRGSSPLVVHCSAGVGRTGAFIALDTAMYQIEEEEKVDIFGIVYKMRLNRVSMVQNERQYVFIYETVADIIRNYQEEKRKKSNDFFVGNLPKSDTVSDLIYQNVDNSALVINEDIRNLL